MIVVKAVIRYASLEPLEVVMMSHRGAKPKRERLAALALLLRGEH